MSNSNCLQDQMSKVDEQGGSENGFNEKLESASSREKPMCSIGQLMQCNNVGTVFQGLPIFQEKLLSFLHDIS